MVEKGIRGRICHAIHRYAKANTKYMKNYDKNIESSYLVYLDANNLYGWAMSQNLPVNGFECFFHLHKDFQFLAERKSKNPRSMFVAYMTNKIMLYT